MTQISASQYRTLVGNPNQRRTAKPAAIKAPESSKQRSRRQLTSMGMFFDLDSKKVKYYIDQLELSGKL